MELGSVQNLYQVIVALVYPTSRLFNKPSCYATTAILKIEIFFAKSHWNEDRYYFSSPFRILFPLIVHSSPCILVVSKKQNGATLRNDMSRRRGWSILLGPRCPRPRYLGRHECLTLCHGSNRSTTFALEIYQFKVWVRIKSDDRYMY